MPTDLALLICSSGAADFSHACTLGVVAAQKSVKGWSRGRRPVKCEKPSSLYALTTLRTAAPRAHIHLKDGAHEVAPSHLKKGRLLHKLQEERTFFQKVSGEGRDQNPR